MSCGRLQFMNPACEGFINHIKTCPVQKICSCVIFRILLWAMSDALMYLSVAKLSELIIHY